MSSRRHGDAGARDPRQEGSCLKDADEDGGAEAETLDRLVVRIPLLMSEHGRRGGGSPAFVATAEPLGGEQDPAVDDQEAGGEPRVPEERFQRVLQEEPDHPRGHRSDDQQQRESLVGGLDAATHRGADEPGDDPGPIAAVEEEQRGGRAKVEHGEDRDECGVGFPKVEPDERRHHDGVAERGHGEQLGQPLQGREEKDQTGAQHRQSLPAAGERSELDSPGQAAACAAARPGPDWRSRAMSLGEMIPTRRFSS